MYMYLNVRVFEWCMFLGMEHTIHFQSCGCEPLAVTLVSVASHSHSSMDVCFHFQVANTAMPTNAIKVTNNFELVQDSRLVYLKVKSTFLVTGYGQSIAKGIPIEVLLPSL